MMIALGNFFFRYRNALFPVVFLVLLLLSPPRPWSGSPAADIWVDLLGLVVALAGQALRVLTIGYDYIRRGGKDYAVYAERLVQGGVFAHSRNPLYLGNILIVLGLALIANSAYVYLVGLPFFLLAYAAIIAAEEDYLRRKFGAEYDDYCRRVNRLWPDWTGFGKSVEDMEFSWRRVVKKEYNTTFVWLAMALGLKLWDLESLPGPVSTGAVVSYLALLALLVAGYLAARLFKKTRRPAG
jgi:protein-S-isoprenylcysteine O-methyltransferase Ste14